MKVENSNLKGLSQTGSGNLRGVERAYRAGQSSGTSESNSLVGKDRATLSESARLLAKAYADLEQSADVRPEVVDALRKKIEDGTYQIPHEQIVQRLMDALKFDQ